MDTEGLNRSLYEDFTKRSKTWLVNIDSLEFAKRLDKEDPLKEFKDLFYYPKKKDLEGVDMEKVTDENEESIYLCGQSVGLQLKSVESNVLTVLKDWAHIGNDLHFKGTFPALLTDSRVKEPMAYIVGAEPSEVVIMNGITVNIHVLLSSFYKPTPNRHKILMIANGFHSDRYAAWSHVEFRNYDPKESIIFVEPRKGEYTPSDEDIIDVIKREGKSIAVVFIEGVHFFSGRKFDMKAIAEAGHEQGCIVGFDLAHAAGNVKLEIHDWNVDFAMWSTYKYLNSSPGNMAAAFVHRRHTEGNDGMLPAIRGWWGLREDRKFAFDFGFTPAEGTDRFKMSNSSPILACMMLPNLKVFREAGIDRLQQKQRLLTGYLEYLLRRHIVQNGKSQGIQGQQNHIITPNDPKKRGSQISLMVNVPILRVKAMLKAKGIMCDARPPSIIRITPAPLYTTFTAVHRFVYALKEILDTLEKEKSPEK